MTEEINFSSSASTDPKGDWKAVLRQHTHILNNQLGAAQLLIELVIRSSSADSPHRADAEEALGNLKAASNEVAELRTTLLQWKV